MSNIEIQKWMEILGWTLLHSLWQGLLVVVVLIVIRRLFPAASPSVKYAFGTAALLLLTVACGVTMYVLYPETAIALQAQPATTLLTFTLQNEPAQPVAELFSLSDRISPWLPTIVNFWLIGMMLFGVRLVAMWYRSVRLQRLTIPVTAEWQARLNELAETIGLRQVVRMGQSQAVDAPLLLGYLKPVILLPVGLLSRLSTEQVESILLHELAHIRRHDFAVNFLQSTIEVIFFFNPFVWIISSQIRSDRELCCDDIVVQIKSPLVYAQALHQIASAQTLGTSFSLAAAGNKNKLLQRIKWIMKTPERNEERRGKVVPALLVMLALATASWLSIQAYRPERNELARHNFAAIDTIKKDKQTKEHPKEIKSSSRKTVTTYDQNGNARTEVVESLESEPNEFLVPPTELDAPVVPEMPLFGQMDVVAELAEIEPVVNFAFPDTLIAPEIWMGGDHGQWEKEFTDRFRQTFSDFFEKNKPEFEKLMEDVRNHAERNHLEAERNLDLAMTNMGQLRELARLSQGQAERMRERAERMRGLGEDMREKSEMMRSRGDKFQEVLTEQMIKDGYIGKNEKIKNIHWDDVGPITINDKQIKIKKEDLEKYRALRKTYFDEDLFRDQLEQLRHMSEDAALQQNVLRRTVEEQTAQVQLLERSMKGFEKELATQLVNDGYLGKDEKINSLNWDDNGSIKINGKEIKESDKAKYRSLHDKFFKPKKGKVE